MAASTGPTLLGVDVIWVATVLSAVATFAVLHRDLRRDHGRATRWRAASRRSTSAASS